MAHTEVALDGEIYGQPQRRGTDAAISALAERQHGVVGRAQLIALGLSREQIDHRLQLGRLHLLHRGVYAVGHRVVGREGRWMAAVLAGGPRAVLSHRSAAALWGLIRWEGAHDLTVPVRKRSRPGLRFHSAALPADERTLRAGIPVTTVPRTLLDLAAVLPPRHLERAFNQTEVLRLTDPLTLGDLLARHPGRRGCRALQAMRIAPAVTRSELEVRFLSFVAQHGLPRPGTNLAVEGHEVDCVWREQRLVAELDGHAVHATRRAFERDRERDRILTASGWRVIRVTWRQLHEQPAALAADLRRLLGPSYTAGSLSSERQR